MKALLICSLSVLSSVWLFLEVFLEESNNVNGLPELWIGSEPPLSVEKQTKLP